MIIGDTVRLRAPERTDLPDFVRWLNDPAVTVHLSMYAPLSLAAEEQWFERTLGGTDDYRFTIELRHGDGWRAVGICGVHKLDRKNRHASLGICVGEKCVWDQGVGTAALRLLLGWCFDELGLHRVELSVFADNARARRCYEKVGFRLDGTLRQAQFTGGRFQDVLLMSVLEEEWRAAEGNAPG